MVINKLYNNKITIQRDDMNLPAVRTEQRAFFKADISCKDSPYLLSVLSHKISFRSEGRSSNSNGGLLLANFKRPESNAMIKNIRNKHIRRKFRFFVAYEFTTFKQFLLP